MSNTPYTPSSIVEITIEDFLPGIDNLCDTVRDDNDIKIITLCGSVRFKKLYEVINFRLSLKNLCVFGLASFGDNTLGGNITMSEKIILDKTHKDKIINSDAIVIIDPNKYVGESTRSEIEYAKTETMVKIFYLSNFVE